MRGRNLSGFCPVVEVTKHPRGVTELLSRALGEESEGRQPGLGAELSHLHTESTIIDFRDLMDIHLKGGKI